MKLETYKTKNLNLASYIFAKGLEFAGIEGEGREKTLIFIDSLDREVFENQFNSKRNCEVDVWEFIMANKVLKGKIYN